MMNESGKPMAIINISAPITDCSSFKCGIAILRSGNTPRVITDQMNKPYISAATILFFCNGFICGYSQKKMMVHAKAIPKWISNPTTAARVLSLMMSLPNAVFVI
jgi:hypothetical protein